jgi:hypothetical protein
MTAYDKPLFILYAALNQYGYDAHDCDDYDAVRKGFREDLLFKLPRIKAIESYFKQAHRPDICTEHPFWPFVCFLCNTVFLLKISKGCFLPIEKKAVKRHFAPYRNDFPIKMGEKEFAYLTQLPQILNAYVKSAPIEKMWKAYKNAISMPPDVNKSLKLDLDWFQGRFPHIGDYSFRLMFNFMERENYGGIVAAGKKVFLISGPNTGYPKGLVRHELTHIALEPLLKSISDISRFKPLIMPGVEALRRNGYWGHDDTSSVIKVLQDTFARSLCCCLADRDGEPIAQRIAWDKESGFLLVEKIWPKLDNVLNRDFPVTGAELLKILKEISSRS